MHARPAAAVVACALTFEAEVAVSHADRSGDAKSMFALMALGATGGSVLTVRATGADAERAVASITECIAGLA